MEQRSQEDVMAFLKSFFLMGFVPDNKEIGDIAEEAGISKAEVARMIIDIERELKERSGRE